MTAVRVIPVSLQCAAITTEKRSMVLNLLLQQTVFFLAALILNPTTFADSISDKPYALPDLSYLDMASCPFPESFSDIKAWLDSVRQEKLILPTLALEDGDYRSPLGPVLGSSCFSGKRAKLRAEIIQRYETAFAIMLEKNSKCLKAFGFPELISIPSRIQALRVNCKVTGERRTGAAAHPALDYLDGNPSRYVRRHVNWSHEYIIDMNITDDQDIHIDTLWDLESALGHEMLHFGAVNQRVWHNDPAGKNLRDCKDSLFEDRVYFLHSVCSPSGNWGDAFWGNNVNWKSASECENVCQSALSGADEDYKKLARKEGLQGEEYFFAHPYSDEEKKIYCNRVQSASARIRELKKEESTVREGTQAFAEYFNSFTEMNKQKQLLSALNVSSYFYQFTMTSDKSTKEAIGKLKEEKEKFQDSLGKLCKEDKALCKSAPVQEAKRWILDSFSRRSHWSDGDNALIQFYHGNAGLYTRDPFYSETMFPKH